MTLENSPSKVPATDQPFIHFISAEPVTSAESDACAAPLTTKDAPGSVWNVGADRAVRVEVVRPGGAAAQGQDAVLHGE